MTIGAQMQAFQRNIVAASQAMTGPQSRAALHVAARQERDRVLREQAQRAGIAPTDVVIPDGKRGAPIEGAQRLVVIEYGYLREIARAALLAAVAKVPKRTGRYASSFILLADGKEIAGLNEITEATREVAVVNTEPYARRLEIGKRADGAPFVIRSSDSEAIKKASLEIRARYNNVAAVAFAFFDLSAAYVIRGGRKPREIRYPGIRITAP